MAPNNYISIFGNEKTMNLNTLVLANIQASPYFKVQLYELKTYHEVIDEIYYRVSHLEPWEKGSRRTAGQTGMCGGVRGVGAGGIVSSAYCLLYKLLTLKLTRKQLMGLMNHADSPYIRGLGFMYIRYTQPPQDLWSWYEDYLDDEEEVDVKAGGGCVMTIGEMLRQWLTKLEWFSTLFPRIPVPIQKDIELKMKAHGMAKYQNEKQVHQQQSKSGGSRAASEDVSFGEAERNSHRSYSPARRASPPRRRSPRPSPPRHRKTPPKRSTSDDFSRELDRERDRQQRGGKSDDRHRHHHHEQQHQHQHRGSRDHGSSRHDRRRSRSRSRERHHRSSPSSRDKRRH